jgi:hypothetical protein
MNPPAGRIQVGDHVRAPGDRAGRVVRERQISPNGAWQYLVELDAGGAHEFLDYELKKLTPAEQH